MNISSLRVLLPLAVVCSLVLGACKNDPPASPTTQQRTLTGVALDEQGFTVPYAIVEAVSQNDVVLARDTTDEQGNFSLPAVETLAKSAADPATKLRIHHGDFKTWTQGIPMSGTPITVLMTHVDSACGRLTMLVRDVNTLATLAGAEVKLRRNGVLIMTTLTDTTGRAEFNYLIAGQYSLRIAKVGYAVIERSATIQFCDSTSMDLRMSPATGGDTCCHGRLTVLVKNSATSATILGASVKLTKDGMSNQYGTSTNDGPTFDGLCPGTYGLRISKDGFQVLETSVTLTCNQVITVTKELTPMPVDSCCNGVWTTVVKDSATGNPLVGATVKLWKNGAVLTTLTTNASGEAIFTKLCPATYGINASKDGYKGREASVTMGCDDIKSTTLLLKPNVPDTCCTAGLTIRVADSTASTWINGATVTIMQGTTLVATGTTANEGTFIKNDLCSPVAYTVTVSATGFVSKTMTFTYTSCTMKTEKVWLHP